MGKTPFDQHNLDFSQLCHEIAIETIYKPYFMDYHWTAEDKTGSDADMWTGVDCIVRANGLPFSLQERFRREQYADYREVTVTAANNQSGRKGDFFKLIADLYVYGYVKESALEKARNGYIVDDPWIEAVLVNIPRLKHLYLTGAIEPNEAYYRRKNQKILGFPFDELDAYDAIYYHTHG